MVLDASVLVELLLNTPIGARVAARIANPDDAPNIPHLADLEVAQALRRYVRDGTLDAATAAAALDELRALDLQRHAHEPLLERIWELRQNLSAYDAVYVALAEVLDCAVLTSYAPFSRAPGMTERVVLIQA